MCRLIILAKSAIALLKTAIADLLSAWRSNVRWNSARLLTDWQSGLIKQSAQLFIDFIIVAFAD
jgi:hypothetical protein